VGKGTTLVFCDRSDVGRRRSNNQDAANVLPPSSPQQYKIRGWLFLVADGMGAHAAGEEASRIAAERVPLVYEKLAARSPPLALRRAIEQVNGEIHDKGESAAEMKGMGTTCTVLAILPRGALVGHIGDSRAYRIRGRTVQQLSRDHSLIWDLESQPGFSREQAGAVPKNIITRSMGPHAEVDVDIEGPFPVEEDDVFLLCSDGLSGQVTDEEIGLFAAELSSPRQVTDALVGLALVRGAPDNVTVVMARAGAEEASGVSSRDEPWPLSDEAVSRPGGTRRDSFRWRPLLLAAASLFATLVCYGFLREMPADASMLKGCLLVGTVTALAASVASSAYAIIANLGAGDGGRVLPPGARLGKGPYRTYDATPSEALLEGVVASIEAAAEGLNDDDRVRTIEILGRTRQHAAAHGFHEAVAAAAEALSIYKRAVERARGPQAGRGAANPPANRPAGGG
jgi:serine/threonine protein phosphatase PrpC